MKIPSPMLIWLVRRRGRVLAIREVISENMRPWHAQPPGSRWRPTGTCWRMERSHSLQGEGWPAWEAAWPQTGRVKSPRAFTVRQGGFDTPTENSVAATWGAPVPHCNVLH